jgi:hypothetical protein
MSENFIQILQLLSAQENLSEEEYCHIMEICNEKVETMNNEKLLLEINQKIEEFTESLDKESKLYEFIKNMYNVKGYINDDNDITEKYPSIEYVIEVNYNKQNFTFFNEHIYNNIDEKTTHKQCIVVEDEVEDKEKSKSEDESASSSEEEENDKENEKEEEENKTNKVEFETDERIKLFSEKMGWTNEKDISNLTTFLNTIFTVFECDNPIEW